MVGPLVDLEASSPGGCYLSAVAALPPPCPTALQSAAMAFLTALTKFQLT